MLIKEEEVEDKNGRLEEMEELEEGNEGVKTIQLSTFTLASLTTNKSLKVWGCIGDEHIIIMLDCGASHNFLSQELIGRSRLKYVVIPTYLVEVGDGRRRKCQGKCTNFVLEIQGLKNRQEFLIFDIGGRMLFLGLEWLTTLSEVC